MANNLVPPAEGEPEVVPFQSFMVEKLTLAGIDPTVSNECVEILIAEQINSLSMFLSLGSDEFNNAYLLEIGIKKIGLRKKLLEIHGEGVAGTEPEGVAPEQNSISRLTDSCLNATSVAGIMSNMWYALIKYEKSFLVALLSSVRSIASTNEDAITEMGKFGFCHLLVTIMKQIISSEESFESLCDDGLLTIESVCKSSHGSSPNTHIPALLGVEGVCEGNQLIATIYSIFPPSSITFICIP